MWDRSNRLDWSSVGRSTPAATTINSTATSATEPRRSQRRWMSWRPWAKSSVLPLDSSRSYGIAALSSWARASSLVCSRMSGGQCVPRLLRQQRARRRPGAARISAIWHAGQFGVALQDDGNPLFVAEHPKVGNDRLGGGRRRGPVNQLNALSVFPGQLDGSTSGLYHRPERLDARMLHPGQPPIQLREDHLDEPLGPDRITREEVGRGLNERTLSLDHSGVLLVADTPA